MQIPASLLYHEQHHQSKLLTPTVHSLLFKISGLFLLDQENMKEITVIEFDDFLQN
jgi:hypothetical protein